MAETPEKKSYVLYPGRRSILAQIYLPKKISRQGEIYDSLRDGLDLAKIKFYLRGKASDLLNEFAIYPHWLDPNRYTPTPTEYENLAYAARARIEQLEQVFFGWSTYEVDGVFLKGDGSGKIDEERTQVFLLMFKFENPELEREAREQGYPEAYRAILYWVLSEYGHTNNYRVWDAPERGRFVARHALWSEEQKRYASGLYARLAPKVSKWIDDCGLFVFGYLVRRFWETVLKQNLKDPLNNPVEDTIWVSSIFHLNINTLEPGPLPPPRVILPVGEENGNV